MKVMAKQRFRAWQRSGKQHCDVFYYRDGVSTSQYDDVLASEVAAIKEAWRQEFAGSQTDVRVTAIVAVKRHHTRFFPLPADAQKNGNCKAGTLVDRGIVSPFFSEFFLQSHHALHGTALPTLYFVLENGTKMSDTDIQNFVSYNPAHNHSYHPLSSFLQTHRLCYTYVRATMGVSYAPPGK
jgi:eukaryotic translation initiation factor 2C